MKQEAAQYQPEKPGRQQPEKVICYGGYSQKQIIADGIQNFSYKCFFVEAPGYVTIKKIRKTGNANKWRQYRPDRPDFQCDNQENYRRYHGDPEKCNFAGNIHRCTGFSGFCVKKQTFVNYKEQTYSSTKNKLDRQKKENKNRGKNIKPGSYKETQRFSEKIDYHKAPYRFLQCPVL